MFKSFFSRLARVRRSLSRSRAPGSPRRVALRANEHWKIIRSAASLPIRCLRGKVWITVEGRRDDIVLTPGHAWSLDSRGLAIVGALSDAVVCFGEG
jgi:Protein of unknown function (DUF2917)